MKPLAVLHHVSHEHLGALAEALARRGIPWSTSKLFAGERPALRLADCGGLIVLGGPMNVDETERFPFLADEVRWIQQALDRELPVLGVCLGAQLLAKALGARVFPNGRKEIGWCEIEPAPAAVEDALCAGCAASQTVFQWHGDTFDPPPGAVQLARSAICEQQAFRSGTNAYGLQFHVEVTPEMAAEWLDVPENAAEVAGLPEVDPAAIRAASPAAWRRMQPFAARLMDAFAALVLKTAG